MNAITNDIHSKPGSNTASEDAFEQTLSDALNRLDLAQLRAEFLDQEEAIVIKDFLPEPVLNALLTSLPTLENRIHRNFIPGHKKGGSISRYDLDNYAPVYARLYESKTLWAFLEALAARQLLPCPPDDPHTYALYYYTEAGDHIGYHYDTSYYKDSRYTLLFGLEDTSSCVLECQLYKDNPQKETQQIDVQLLPGTLVFFNGDKLWHRVTPLGENERRVALTMEFLTSRDMHRFKRFVSNMKDAIAYFGFKQVFKRT